MENSFTLERVHGDSQSPDVVLFAFLILLVGIGVSVLFSASFYYADRLFENPRYFVQRQFLWISLGGIAAFAVYRMKPRAIQKFIPLILFVSLVTMVLTFVPGVGTQVMGARRWIILFGMSLQPSELVKLALILYLAHLFAKKQDRMTDTINTILPPLVILALFISLTYLQNDFSTSLYLLFLGLLMFFIAGVRFVFFILLGSMAVPLATIMLFTREHRVQRLIAFLDPSRDPIGSGYQIIASRSALSGGGLWGRGVGAGIKKLGSLPEAHSDFVFSVLAEELGFIGVVAILFLFLAFAFRGYRVSLGASSLFGYFAGVGITSSILFQALLNMAVVAGIVPATGIPLPFFSAGGSSIFMTLVMCGILLGISRNSRQEGAEIGGQNG
ncbi:MAG: putative lipid II flippase FtsW [Spirochaetales bacterium]|nr:putative lipid II flippase FtsW [Spirochaetales bacterium]MCF7937630.1 putative lipid II flippase FtsW [Spirochaetales bacterium]